MNFSVSELFEGILAQDKRLLGKAITLIESKKPEHRAQAEELLKLIIPHSGKSIRIGITGVPGAGKSTFIESFGKYAISQGKKVAVLAIDPSSSVHKGSILGDKTRMEELAKDENAFIRPSPSSGMLGGVANTTFETMLACEAAGYDYILIETVGVGQSEVLVADITDVLLMLKVTGTGDELQGIKRGLMEMVDLIFINKVEEHNQKAAKLHRAELIQALHFQQPKEQGWNIPILMGSALQNQGLETVYQKAEEFVNLKKKSQRWEAVRSLQAEKRFEYWVHEYMVKAATENEKLAEQYEQHKKNASTLKSNPSSEAKTFVEELLQRKL